MSDNDEPRIRAKLTNEWVDYPHNDVEAAAGALWDRVNAGWAQTPYPRDLFVDMMACATMIAFALEGYVNFMGSRLFKGNDEWLAFEELSVREKIKCIRRNLHFQINWNKRPYLTATKLIDLRHMLAHPKPQKSEPREWIADGTHSEFKKTLRNQIPPHARILTHDFINEAFEDIKAIWEEFLAEGKIEQHETWSGGSQGFEYIEHVTPDVAHRGDDK